MTTATEQLTYEQYLTEGEVKGRYDIIDGVRIFMTNPTIGHQETQGNIYACLRAWRQVSQEARVILAPCDILVQRAPLRTRQPDVLVISHDRFGERDLDDPAPLDPAPELVIEILSPGNAGRPLEDKLADYINVGVQEAWIVNRTLRTVNVLRLTSEGALSVAVYGMGETVQSITFATLTLAVADVFAL